MGQYRFYFCTFKERFPSNGLQRYTKLLVHKINFKPFAPINIAESAETIDCRHFQPKKLFLKSLQIRLRTGSMPQLRILPFIHYHPKTDFNFCIPALLTVTFAPQCNNAKWLSFSYGSMRTNWSTGIK